LVIPVRKTKTLTSLQLQPYYKDWKM